MAKPYGEGCRDPSSATRLLPDREEEPSCSPLAQLPSRKSSTALLPDSQAGLTGRPGSRHSPWLRAQPPDTLPPWPPDLHYFSVWVCFFFFLSRNRCAKLSFLGHCQDVRAHRAGAALPELRSGRGAPPSPSLNACFRPPSPPRLSLTPIPIWQQRASPPASGREPQGPGEPASPSARHAGRGSIAERGDAAGRPELCRGTTAKLSRAGSPCCGRV